MRANQRRIKRIERNLKKVETKPGFGLIIECPDGFEHEGKVYATKEEIPGYGDVPGFWVTLQGAYSDKSGKLQNTNLP